MGIDKPACALHLNTLMCIWTAPVGMRRAATEQNFDLKAFALVAAPEQLRPPRVVRVGLVQHSIVLPTTAPFSEQAQVGLRTPCN